MEVRRLIRKPDQYEKKYHSRIMKEIKQIKFISDFIRQSLGINISTYENSYLKKTLQNRISESKFGSFEEYCTFIKQSSNLEGKPVVLIVEDNPDNMLSVKALLSDTYTVLEAVNGMDGVEKAKKFKPNLILMDIALPQMDGIEALKMIRNNNELQHIKVISLTASAMTQDREIVLTHGFDAFIAKPIDEQEFFNTINTTLYGK